MIRYYFKTALRNIRINQKFSIINIAGFAFGISICLAILLFLIKEYSYDRYHRNSKRIYRLIDVKNNSSSIDYRTKDILLANFDEIESACIVQRVSSPTEIKSGNQGFYIDDIMSVDNNFFHVFTVPFVSGNSQKPFVNINSGVITESNARKIFGKENPVGKEILVGNMVPVTITGVIKDFPDYSSISAGLLVNAENDMFKFSRSCKDGRDKSSYRYPFRIYLLLNGNINVLSFSSKINSKADKLAPYIKTTGLLPLKDIYLNDKTTGSQSKKGNPELLKILAAIAAIILVLAIINYINLAVARQIKRNKETGIRKTIGAFRRDLIYLYLMESMVTIFIAFVLALLLVQTMLPFYNKIFDSHISLVTLLHFPLNAIVLSSVFLIGLLAGVGPALALSAIDPVKVISGGVLPGKNSFLRNILTIFQFTVSIALIFCIVLIQRQIYYVKHLNPGFNEEKLLWLDVPNIKPSEAQKLMLFVDQLRQSPYIKNYTVSNGVPGAIATGMGSNIVKDKKEMFHCILADTSFMKTFDMRIIKGRNLQPGDFDNVCMINETAYHYLEFDNLENRKFNNGKNGGYDIIGVVHDFNFSSMHTAIGPVCIIFNISNSKYTFQPHDISIRFSGNSLTQGMDFVKKTWKEMFPDHVIKYQFYDDWFNSMYQKEEKFASAVGLFALLAIGISCIGILGLAIFSSEKRIKEIGIRKVNGARITEILSMLNKDLIKWVIIAFFIATPAGYFAMHKWLQNFAYKTDLSWWIFALAGFIALGIALITVSWQSWKAATRNPVEALRYE
jgi:putative ABC transport system permease protein